MAPMNTAMNTTVTFLDVTPYSLVGGYERFGGICYLHHRHHRSPKHCNYLPDYTASHSDIHRRQNLKPGTILNLHGSIKGMDFVT
jgi:hypothetical protein